MAINYAKIAKSSKDIVSSSYEGAKNSSPNSAPLSECNSTPVNEKFEEIPVNITQINSSSTSKIFSAPIKVDHELNRSPRSTSRELKPWVSELEPVSSKDLIIEFTGRHNKKFDQFEANKRLFGVETTFDESQYTTMLDISTPDYKKREKEASRLANEIQNTATKNIHLAEERGQILERDADIDDEERYGAVIRSPNAYVPPAFRSKSANSPDISKKVICSPPDSMAKDIESSSFNDSNLPNANDIHSKIEANGIEISKSNIKISEKEKITEKIKEFKLNPNAAEFKPSATPLLPPMNYPSSSPYYVQPPSSAYPAPYYSQGESFRRYPVGNPYIQNPVGMFYNPYVGAYMPIQQGMYPMSYYNYPYQGQVPMSAYPNSIPIPRPQTYNENPEKQGPEKSVDINRSSSLNTS